MTMQAILAMVALVAALLLTIQHRPLIFPIIALVVSGIELLMALHVLRFSLGSLPLDLIFGAALIVTGAAVFVRTSGKTVVAAATVVALVGGLQVLNGLHIH